jgi:hypothetical protein
MGQPMAARWIVLYTQTPGFRAQIWGSNSQPDPAVFVKTAGGWTELADVPAVQRQQRIPLSTAGVRYRYYLVWIKTLPPGRMLAALNEIAIYKLSR